MSSTDKKVVVVFGATGNQGGSVISAILGDKKASSEFKLRAITRDPSKPNAKALSNQGVECVSANMDDVNSLKKALEGAYAVFGVTNFWEHLSGEKEFQQGKNMVDAAKETGVQHFVWSSLINVTEFTNGELPNVHHFDAKGRIADYLAASGVPYTNVLAGFYMSNIPGAMLRPDDDSNSSYTFALPCDPHKSRLPMVDPPADMGKFVKGVLLNREKTLGKSYAAAAEWLTPQQIVEQFTEVTGKQAKYRQLSEEEYKAGMKGAGMGDSVVQELYENMLLLDEKWGYFGTLGSELGLGLFSEGEKCLSWKDFVKREYVDKKDKDVSTEGFWSKK